MDTYGEGIRELFIGPDTIFSGDIVMLDANIFDKVNVSKITDLQNSIKTIPDFVDLLSDTASPGYMMVMKIRDGIASTYTAIRDIAGFIMLAGLIFTGIKILLGSNIPSKNTRWLEALQDWLIGMVLLIFSHIIMIGIFYIAETLSQALSNSLNGMGSLNYTLMKQCLVSIDSAEQVIYLIMMGYLIYLTVVFAVAYFKRLLWVCVLIVIAPIVSVMYAFGGTTKRIYSSWLKEFITTALIQPFHLIIYYTLVSVPLNMVNSTGTFDFGTNMFEIIYALGAIGFIRPAEKYIRKLFGMDSGIAAMASYDSGKQTIDATVKAAEAFAKKMAAVAEKVGKIIAVAAIAVCTGGAGAAVAGEGALAEGALAEGALTEGALTEGALTEGVLTEGELTTLGGAEGELGAEGLMEPGLDGGALEPDIGNSMLDTYDEGFGSSDYDYQYRDSWARELEGNMEPSLDYSTPNDYMNHFKGAGNFNDEEIASEYGYDNVRDMLKDGGFTDDEISEYMNGMDENSESSEKIEDSLKKLKDNSDKEEDDKKKSDSISADNVNITTETVNMNGDTDEEGNQNIKIVEDESQEDESEKDESQEDESQEDKENSNGNIKLEVPPPDFRDVLFSNLKNNGIDEDLTGLGNEAYKGINSIRDTFYVDNGAPGDWKKTAERTDARIKEKSEKRKENNERKESAFIKDSGNKEFLLQNMTINGMPIMDYYGKVYEGKPQEYIREKAEERVEKELEKMKGYAKYNMNAEQAYPIYQLQKKYGYTEDEAIKAYAGFERFNRDPENIAHINQTYEVNVNSVSEAIPDAKEYYHNGYDNINDMRWVDYMSAKLNKTPEYAMDIDRTLRKKGGKIKYDGDNDELRDVIGQINEHYRA